MAEVRYRVVQMLDLTYVAFVGSYLHGLPAKSPETVMWKPLTNIRRPKLELAVRECELAEYIRKQPNPMFGQAVWSWDSDLPFGTSNSLRGHAVQDAYQDPEKGG